MVYACNRRCSYCGTIEEYGGNDNRVCSSKNNSYGMREFDKDSCYGNYQCIAIGACSGKCYKMF